MDKVVDNMIEGLFDYGLKATFAKVISHPTFPQVPQSIVQPERGFGLTRTSRLPHASPIASSLQPVDASTGKNTLEDIAVTAPRIQPKDVQDQEVTVADADLKQFNPTSLTLYLAMLAALQPEDALAKGGEFGIWEGRIVSLAHPTIMAIMYGASAYAGFTGWQWRRLRELATEISELKQERKKLQDKVDAAGEEGPPPALKQELATLSTKIDEISETRKAMGKD